MSLEPTVTVSRGNSEQTSHLGNAKSVTTSGLFIIELRMKQRAKVT